MVLTGATKHTTRVASAALLFLAIVVLWIGSAQSAIAADRLATTTSAQKATQSATTTSSLVTVYRLYNAKTGEHLYTTSNRERTVLKNDRDWFYEGVAWRSPKTSTTPVFRLYNRTTGEHLYTASKNERKVLSGKADWRDEGIAWYSDDKKRHAIKRLYSNRAAKIASHHYTLNAHEVEVLTTKRGWRNEGIAWYAAQGRSAVKDGWVKAGNKWQWWDAGVQKKNCWVNTAKTQQYNLSATRELYRIDKNGSMVTGEFKVGGKRYYADKTTGRVVRNKNITVGGKSYFADADGVLWAKTFKANATAGKQIAAAAVALSGTVKFVAPPGKTYEERQSAVPPNSSAQGNWTVYNKVYPKLDTPYPWHAHCGTSTLLAVKWAGADDDWGGIGATKRTYDYLMSSNKWECVGTFSRETMKGVMLQPGDVLLTQKSAQNVVGHICVYAGKEAAQKKYPGTDCSVFESGGGGYWPRLDKLYRPGGSNTEYYVFRSTTKSLSSKYAKYYSEEREKYLV